MTNQEGAILSLPGPILVIGASGFVGANLFRALLGQRQATFGTVHIHKPWRLEGIPSSKCISWICFSSPANWMCQEAAAGTGL